MVASTSCCGGTASQAPSETTRGSLSYTTPPRPGCPGGKPLWLPVDLRSLLQHHQCNPNAVDHAGQTALHVLATSEGGDNTWLTMAATLLEFGTDPGILDYKSRTPEEVARLKRNSELVKMLATDVEKLPRAMTFELDGDPLVRAVLDGDRDKTLLLLSEGRSVMSGCVTGASPILTSHTRPDLPAILPAVMRKVLCDNVEDEVSRIEAQGKNVASNALCKKLRAWKKHVYRCGFDVIRTSCTAGTRDQLCLTARLGLPYSCQLLAIANTRSVTLPPAERQLFVLGTESRRLDALYTLYRDLRISPHSVTDEGKSYSTEFQRLMLVGEIRLLRCVISSDIALRQSLGNEAADLFGEDEDFGTDNTQCLTGERPSIRESTPTFTDDTMLVSDDYLYLTEDTLLLTLPRDNQPIAEDHAFSNESCTDVTDGKPVSPESNPYMKRLIPKDKSTINMDNPCCDGTPSISITVPMIADDNLSLRINGLPPSNDLLALISHLGLVCILHKVIQASHLG
ncbi:uncharacterized protein [Panulirus ornatus]|uniref:uncharacterized protein isoform X2 n=1 Tax=Panulirus ornatus TaxID=150431 RepID=UPI003A89B5FC